MTPFKPGDRVAVYGASSSEGWSARITGEVTNVSETPPRLFVKSDATADTVIAIPQQCRRLRRKQRWEFDGRWVQRFKGDGTSEMLFLPQYQGNTPGIGTEMTLREVPTKIVKPE